MTTDIIRVSRELVTPAGPTGFTTPVVHEIVEERNAQHRKWGPQHHPNGTTEEYKAIADQLRDMCDADAEAHPELGATWASILAEEFGEALAESGDEALRKELIQVAAVATAWVEDIDSRMGSCG